MTVGQAIDRLPLDALRRVAGAQGWRCGWSRTFGKACLAGHAVGDERYVYARWAELLRLDPRTALDLTRAFDAIAKRVGTQRAGRLCSARARRRLVERAVEMDLRGVDYDRTDRLVTGPAPRGRAVVG